MFATSQEKFKSGRREEDSSMSDRRLSAAGVTLLPAGACVGQAEPANKGDSIQGHSLHLGALVLCLEE